MIMRDVLGLTRRPEFKEFVTFLQVMEVFGSGYTEDVDYLNYNKRQSQTHKKAMTEQLKWVLRVYELALYCLKM